MDAEIKMNKRQAAEKAFGSGDYQLAKQIYEDLLHENPNNWEAFIFHSFSILLSKQVLNFKKDCNIAKDEFTEGVVLLRDSDVSRREKALGVFRIFCGIELLNELLLKKALEQKKEKEKNNKKEAVVLYHEDVRIVYEFTAIICMILCDERDVDISLSRDVLLRVANKCLDYYGWEEGGKATAPLLAIRKKVLDYKIQLGEDVVMELQRDKQRALAFNDRRIRRMVIEDFEVLLKKEESIID